MFKNNRKNKMDKIEVFFDGSCRPKNPGGIIGMGVVIYKNDIKLAEASNTLQPEIFLGKTSNQVAEYEAFIMGLEMLVEYNLYHLPITMLGDSMFVIKQMFGNWKIKQGFYVDSAIEAKKLLLGFNNITGKWIPREENQVADELSKSNN